MSTDAGADSRSSRRTWAFIGIGLLVSLVIAGVLSRFASSSPDGLEKVAQDTGFSGDAAQHANSGFVLADYGDVGGIPVGVAGVIGVVIMAAVAFGLFMMLGRKKSGA